MKKKKMLYLYMVCSYVRERERERECVCVCVCIARETERDSMVLRRMFSCVPHFSHPTVSTRPSAYSGSPSIFLRRLWTSCGYCGVKSVSQIWSYSRLYLLPKSTVSPRLQDLSLTAGIYSVAPATKE